MYNSKNKLQITITIILVITLVISISSSAFSYVLLKGPPVIDRHYYTYVFNYKLTSSITTVTNAFNYAITEWDNAINKVTITSSSTSLNKLYDLYNASSADRGGTIGYDQSGTIWYQRFEIWINTSCPSGPGTDPLYYKSTACHEFGHVLGLAHTTGNVIMDTNRVLKDVYYPKSDDISGVKANYGI
ncbi:MAG: matrixin family metalloprotease [Clostridiales bacterium]|nr:matrixin family metalloprotease [Clostridiales bacterium]